MRNNPLFLLLFILFFISCRKEDLGTNTPLRPELIATDPIPSTDFDWENSTTVNIHGTNVVLPWVGGSVTNIPSYVLGEMTSANGWELYYNFPGWADSGPNQNYLIFHNKFTGVLRLFCYNTIFSTNNTEGLFHVLIEGPTATNILHLTKLLSKGERELNPGSIHSNVSQAGYTGFRTGWNCFEVPLVYDPVINQNTKLKLSVYSDQRSVSNITITGTFNSESVGELITTKSSNPLSGLVSGASKKGGELAKDWLKNKIQNGSVKSGSANSILGMILGNAPGLLGGLVQSGISGILSSFIGGFSSSSTTSQNINLFTEGKLSAAGQITTPIPGVINDFKSVSLPGTDYSDGGFLPSKSDAFGSWGLTNVPVVNYTKRGAGQGRILTQTYSTNVSASDVVLNPATIASIESYTVSSELWFYKKYQGSTLPDDLQNNPGGGEVQDLWMGFDNGEEMYADAENQFYRNVSRLRIKNLYFDNTITYLNGYVPGFVVKVTVTLIPKAPYNTSPIVMTRSYIPNYQ